MSLTGNGSKSIRRQDVLDQKSIAIGLKKLVMAHKATLADTGINLSSLSTPSEMSSLGFTNPSAQEILAANLKFYRNNLRIVSSHKGLLMDYLSYNVTSSSRIDFVGFTAEADEIFVITFDDNAKTGVTMVDSEPIIATGELAVGVTDFNVGVPYEVGINSASKQIGKVLVFRNGKIQFRNPNNGTSGGNYQEIAASLGLGVIVRFNNAPVGQPDNIIVVGLGTAYRPDGSVLAEIENLAGQLDVHREILEEVTGETVPPGVPNNTDLKAFGDQVLDHEQRLDALESPADVELWLETGNGYGSTNTRIRRYSTVLKNTLSGYATYTDSATDGTQITIQKSGLYSFYRLDRNTGAVAESGISVNSSALTTPLFSLTYAQGRRIYTQTQTAIPSSVSGVLRLAAGDIVRPHDGNLNNETTLALFQMLWVGE